MHDWCHLAVTRIDNACCCSQQTLTDELHHCSSQTAQANRIRSSSWYVILSPQPSCLAFSDHFNCNQWGGQMVPQNLKHLAQIQSCMVVQGVVLLVRHLKDRKVSHHLRLDLTEALSVDGVCVLLITAQITCAGTFFHVGPPCAGMWQWTSQGM